MIQFFVKHKKVRGAITIFLTIIYMAMYLLVGVFVDGGRLRMAQTMMEDVQQIATENVMSQYNRGLYEYYGLLGLNEELDDITKDVKRQIEQSIGLDIPEDTVKSFIEDIWVAGNSVVNNIDILKSTNSVINKVKNLKSAIDDDIVDYSKRFDPYGLKNLTATISYIDLTNTEALRAQIRDEMRYSAPLVLAANFSEVAEKFLGVSGSANAIKDVTDKITTKGEDIENKQKEYYNSIDDFAKKFDEFVEKSYKKGGICKKVESAYENIKEKVKNAVKDIANNIAKSLYNWIFGKKDNTDNNQNISNDNSKSDEEKNIVTNMAGYDNVVVSESLVLKDYVDEFDKDTWPDGDEFVEEEVTGVDDEGNVETDSFYHGVCPNCGENYKHDAAVRKITDKKYDVYHVNIDKLNELCQKAIEQADSTIKLVEEIMVMINKLEGELKREYDKNVGNDDVQTIYNTSMETYVRQWNKLYDEKETLENFKNKLEKIKNLIEKADSTAKEKADRINKLTTEHLLNESWESPYTNSNITTLSNEQKDILAEYDKLLIDLKNDEKGIKNFTIHSENERLKGDVFELLNYVVKTKKNDNVDVDNDDRTFGKIKISKKSDNPVYNPSEGLVEDDMNDDNIIKKINAIFEQATQIVAAIPTELANNIYDETYILTHCRDYVHTYRYRNLDDKNDKDLDTILNPKFVKDQHETKYLTNTQFKEIEQTPAEIEYILWGLGDDEDEFDTGANVAIMYANIFIIRLALNYIAALTSPHCVKEATALAAACGPFAPAVRFAAPLIYALPKSITDTKEIMFECKKIQFYNGSKDLHLWNAVTDLVEKAKDDANETMKEMLDNMKEKGEELLNDNQLGTSLICAEVISKAKSEKYVKVHDVAIHLGGLKFFDEKSVSLDSSNTNVEGKKVDNSIKAGYSDYLLIYLFLRGIKKESQIANLRNVIETNMRKAQNDDFRLSKTYSQIGVETECDIKYIFMTQSIMRKYFNNASNYDKATLRTKTAFAY